VHFVNCIVDKFGLG